MKKDNDAVVVEDKQLKDVEKETQDKPKTDSDVTDHLKKDGKLGASIEGGSGKEIKDKTKNKAEPKKKTTNKKVKK